MLCYGASRGIGKACALHLAELSAKVVVNYARSSVQADEVVSRIKEMGGEAIAIQADVTKQSEVES